MDRQRARARASWQASVRIGDVEVEAELKGRQPTEFLGYDRTQQDGLEILDLLQAGRSVAVARAGSEADVILDRTPFYAEAGGQVGDRGRLLVGTTEVAQIRDVQAPVRGIRMHRATLFEDLVVGDRVSGCVDASRRDATRRNHTATHLLHARCARFSAARKQAGSVVAPDRLRFDVTHYAALEPGEIDEVENLVNEHILLDMEVLTEVKDLDEAVREGAMALFGEKYQDSVRVVTVGSFSKELCGGTHVARTGEVGIFKVLAETSSAAGVRRLEAVTGHGAFRQYRESAHNVQRMASMLRVTERGLVEALDKLLVERRRQDKAIGELKTKLALAGVDTLAAQAREIDGMRVLAAKLEDVERKQLRPLADALRERIGSGLVVLGTVQKGRVALVAAATKDVAGTKVHAGQVVRWVAQLVGGGRWGPGRYGRSRGQGSRGASRRLRSGLRVRGPPAYRIGGSMTTMSGQETSIARTVGGPAPYAETARSAPAGGSASADRGACESAPALRRGRLPGVRVSVACGVVLTMSACSSTVPRAASGPALDSDYRSRAHRNRTRHGAIREGPAVDSEGALYFTSRGTYKGIVRWTERSGADRFASVATLAGPGGLWTDAEDNLYLTASAERAVQVLAADGALQTIGKDFEANPEVAQGPNDITVSGSGIVYFTDPNGFYGESAPGTVYRIGLDGAVTVFDDTVVGPNGIVLSADDRTLYVAPQRQRDAVEPCPLALGRRWLGLRPEGDGCRSRALRRRRDGCRRGGPNLADLLRLRHGAPDRPRNGNDGRARDYCAAGADQRRVRAWRRQALTVPDEFRYGTSLGLRVPSQGRDAGRSLGAGPAAYRGAGTAKRTVQERRGWLGRISTRLARLRAGILIRWTAMEAISAGSSFQSEPGDSELSPVWTLPGMIVLVRIFA